MLAVFKLKICSKDAKIVEKKINIYIMQSKYKLQKAMTHLNMINEVGLFQQQKHTDLNSNLCVQCCYSDVGSVIYVRILSSQFQDWIISISLGMEKTQNKTKTRKKKKL